MKLRSLVSFAGLTGPFILSAQSHAAYLGLGVELHSTVNLNGVDRWVYRVYAVFDDPDDYLIAVAGSPATGALVIKSLHSDGTPGSNFFNAGGGSTAPSQSVISSLPNAEWDTFATIGVAIDDNTDQTNTAPGFPSFINGNELVNNNIAWFISGPFDQGTAGGPNGKPGVNVGFTGLSGLGILILQLTVNAGDNVAGSVAISVKSGGTNFQYNDQIFGAVIPTPATLALFALPSFFARRRRG